MNEKEERDGERRGRLFGIDCKIFVEILAVACNMGLTTVLVFNKIPPQESSDTTVGMCVHR